MSGVTMGNGVTATDVATTAQVTGGTIDGTPIGQSTPASGAFTTLSASGQATLNTLASSGAVITGGSVNGTPVGNTTPASGAFTTLNATSTNILGPMSAEGVNSTNNGQVASTTNSGVALSGTFPELLFYDSTQSANNRTASILWSSGGISFRVKNDAGNSATSWLNVTGGQASGVTGITTNSGSGAWAHTGYFSATGTVNSSTGLSVKEVVNGKQGVATLVAGTVVVNNTSVTANSRIFLTVQSLGTVTAPKAVAVTARTAGTSFTITSADNTDTSVVAYEIFEPGI